MKTNTKDAVVVWFFIIIIQLLVSGPIGWLLKTIHGNYSEFKINISEQVDIIKKDKIGRSEYEKDMGESKENHKTLENRIYEYLSGKPHCSDD